MPFTNDGKHFMLDALAAVVDEISLHTADPGATGANEVEADSDTAYVRKTPSWAASAGGEKALSGNLIFDVPAGTTVTHIGFWESGSDPVFHGSASLDSPEVFSGAGTLTLNTGTKLNINDPA